MARSTISTFQAPTGLFYCVTLKGDNVYGPFITEKEVRIAKRMIPDHERANAAVHAALKPQVGEECDVSGFTR